MEEKIFYLENIQNLDYLDPNIDRHTVDEVTLGGDGEYVSYLIDGETRKLTLTPSENHPNALYLQGLSQGLTVEEHSLIKDLKGRYPSLLAMGPNRGYLRMGPSAVSTKALQFFDPESRQIFFIEENKILKQFIDETSIWEGGAKQYTLSSEYFEFLLSHLEIINVHDAIDLDKVTDFCHGSMHFRKGSSEIDPENLDDAIVKPHFPKGLRKRATIVKYVENAEENEVIQSVVSDIGTLVITGGLGRFEDLKGEDEPQFQSTKYKSILNLYGRGIAEQWGEYNEKGIFRIATASMHGSGETISADKLIAEAFFHKFMELYSGQSVPVIHVIGSKTHAVGGADNWLMPFGETLLLEETNYSNYLKEWYLSAFLKCSPFSYMVVTSGGPTVGDNLLKNFSLTDKPSKGIALLATHGSSGISGAYGLFQMCPHFMIEALYRSANSLGTCLTEISARSISRQVFSFLLNADDPEKNWNDLKLRKEELLNLAKSYYPTYIARLGKLIDDKVLVDPLNSFLCLPVTGDPIPAVSIKIDKAGLKPEPGFTRDISDEDIEQYAQKASQVILNTPSAD